MRSRVGIIRVPVDRKPRYAGESQMNFVSLVNHGLGAGQPHDGSARAEPDQLSVHPAGGPSGSAVTDDSFQYAGSEVEVFAGAANWRSYWCSRARPYVGRRVLEVGAGIGSVTRSLWTAVALRQGDRSLPALRQAFDLPGEAAGLLRDASHC